MSTVSGPPQLTAASHVQAIPIGFGTAAASAVEGVGFADVTRVIKQRRVMIVVVFVLVYALVVLATYLTYKYAPTYTSEAFFELDPPRGSDAFVGTTPVVDTRYLDQMLKTEASKLKQLGILFDVVSKPEVKATEYYKWYENDAQKCAVGLQKDLQAGPVADTRLIRVALACKRRDEARAIVRAIVERYLAQFTEHEQGELGSQLNNLRNTLAALHKELDDKQRELERLRETSDIPNLQAERQVSQEYIGTLKADLSQLDARGASLQAQMDSIGDLSPDDLPLTTEDQLIIESDPVLRFWRQQVENLDIEIRALLLRIGENHRDVVFQRQRRQSLLEKEGAKREELISLVRNRRAENLRMELAQTLNVQQRIQDQLTEAESRERDLDRSVQRFQSMEEERQRILARISQVEDAKTKAEHALADKTRNRLRLVQPPQEAVKPTRPNPLAFLGGGLMLALASGFGLAFLREFTDKAIRTPLDVARYARLSVLGSIPLLDDEEADVEDMEHAVRLAPRSLVAEAFRKVRTNLQFSGPLETQRTLLITSASPGDGKTAVAINLASTLANSAQRVLLIDCNFRRPAIRREFANSRPEGLSNVLVAQATLELCVTRTEQPNLDILTSGPLPPTPAELLGSAAMRALLEEATQRYHRVILDGPPTLLISDATVLATQVDGVVLVARAEDNTKGTLKRARDQLEAINARVLGAILNGVRARAGGYFRQQYREFYDYISDETIPELPGPGADGDQEGADGDPKSADGREDGR